MKIIAKRISAHPLDDQDLEIQLYEVEDSCPYRVRLVDIKTGEVGPNISIFYSLSRAANFFENNSPVW